MPNQNELQLVTFNLNGQEFGINILDVQEINRLINITKIPEVQYYIEGIINLRNKIIPVINLKKRIGFADDGNYGKSARIIVVNIEDSTIGFIVDSVSEVLRFSEDSLEPVPELANIKSDYVKGVVKNNDKIFILIDLKSIITESSEQGIFREI